MRQLGLACSLYANDNRDRLPTNADRNNTPFATQNWICPAGTALDWSSSSQNTNTLWLTISGAISGQPYAALIGSYVAKSVNIFACPGDNYLSPLQQAFWYRTLTHRIRSCAMNGAMGDGSKWFGYRADGTPNGGHASMPLFYNAAKVTDLHSPGPSASWLIMDEHPDSNDDACFYVDPAAANGSGTVFVEVPGSMHNSAAGMVFADGHSEAHVWQGRITTQPVKFTTYLQSVHVNADAASLNDLTWLAQHTPAN